jgi:putative ABC transport system substrate-binding protein
VGYVVYGPSAPRGHLLQAFLAGMREHGYVEGKNLIVETSFAEGSSERLREGASALATLKLDVIVTTCSPSTRAVMQATSGSGTPVVMAVVTDPVGQGLVASLARPGGNITGRSSQVEDTLPKMLDLFSAVLPKGSRVAVLHNTNNPVHPLLWERALQAGNALDMKLVRIDVAGAKDFAAAFDTITREHLGALVALPDDGMMMNSRARLVELAAKHRIPAFYGVREFVDVGGLMSYGENYALDYRGTAAYVGKILAGAKPASLPVEQPTRFEFVVNLGAAKALGLTIPQSLLVRADDVIE